MEPDFPASFSELQLRQLDAALDRWRSADLPARPPCRPARHRAGSRPSGKRWA